MLLCLLNSKAACVHLGCRESGEDQSVTSPGISDFNLVGFFFQPKCLQKGCVSLFPQMMNNVEFEHKRQGSNRSVVNSLQRLYANKRASFERAYHIQTYFIQSL